MMDDELDRLEAELDREIAADVLKLRSDVWHLANNDLPMAAALARWILRQDMAKDFHHDDRCYFGWYGQFAPSVKLDNLLDRLGAVVMSGRM